MPGSWHIDSKRNCQSAERLRSLGRTRIEDRKGEETGEFMQTFRAILAGALAVALVVLMMGLPACDEEDAVPPPREPHASRGPNIPNATVEAFRRCGQRAEYRKKGEVYAFRFNVEVAESGSVERVKLKDSYPGNAGTESCLRHALEDMQLPPYVTGRLFTQQTAAVSPESRGLIGNPILIAVGILLEMIPESVVVEEATFMVAVILSGTAEATEARKRRGMSCDSQLTACLLTPLADLPGRSAGSSRCKLCWELCKQDGTWPNRAYSYAGRPLRCDYWKR